MISALVASLLAATPAGSAPVPSTQSLSLAQTGIIPEWMDPTADPCQDFFQYACGGFVKTTAIPSDRATWGTTEIIQKGNEELIHEILEKAAAHPGDDAAARKLGDYYAACVDEPTIERAGLQPIQPLLAEIAHANDFAAIAKVVTALHAKSISVLFDIDAQQDFKDATQMIAGMDQDGLGLPDRDYYLKDDGNMKGVREFYRLHVGRMLGLIGLKPAERAAAVADVMRIETRIATLQQDKVTRRDPYKVYHRIERSGLEKAAPTFPWGAYFEGLGFAQLTQVSVNDVPYFTGIDALLHSEPPAAWRHYLTWHVVMDDATLLGKALIDEAFAMRKKLTGQKELEPRWKRCVRAVDHGLGELLAQPYVAARFGGESKARAAELVESIRAAMRSEMDGLPWMDPATRKAALAKLAAMNKKVGYPDVWRVYDFTVQRSTYAQNVEAARAFELRRRLNKVGKPVDRNEWDMTPPTVNAYYNPSLNELVIPAGELQPPFFSASFYGPVNVGDEGANTIGHELTHGFDDEGSQFDGNGNLRDWWTAGTKKQFEEATHCVQDQYSHYEAVPGVKLNGALTAGENIADIGGVKLGHAALEAWKKAHPQDERTVPGFSDEKLFFLGYAQGWCSKETPESLEMLARVNPHSPPRWRVNGPMADNPSFGKAFQCKVGAPMNPGKVCQVW